MHAIHCTLIPGLLSILLILSEFSANKSFIYFMLFSFLLHFSIFLISLSQLLSCFSAPIYEAKYFSPSLSTYSPFSLSLCMYVCMYVCMYLSLSFSSFAHFSQSLCITLFSLLAIFTLIIILFYLYAITCLFIFFLTPT